MSERPSEVAFSQFKMSYNKFGDLPVKILNKNTFVTDAFPFSGTTSLTLQVTKSSCKVINFIDVFWTYMT